MLLFKWKHVVDTHNSQHLWTNNSMDIFSLDRHLDHDNVLGIPDALLRRIGTKRSLPILFNPSVILRKFIYSEEKKNKSIYLFLK